MAQSSQTGSHQELYEDNDNDNDNDQEQQSAQPCHQEDGNGLDTRNSRTSSPHHSINSNNDRYDARRSRACEACRCSKVRCEQPNPDLPCKRCAKARKECVSSSSARNPKRHKSLNFNDQLLELGGSIDHLITTLRTETQTKRVRRVTDSDMAAGDTTNPGTVLVAPTIISRPEVPLNTSQSPTVFLMEDEGNFRQPAAPSATLSISGPQGYNGAARIGLIATFIRTGISQIISDRTANIIFGRYCVELTANFPAVVFDPATTVAEVRSNKLVLFLAILAASSGGVCDIDTQKRLRRLLTRVLAHCLLNESEYSLHLVQAFIVSALWHIPSEPILGEDSMNIEQLSHAAANIATHIGLGNQGNNKNRDSPSLPFGKDSHRLKTFGVEDLEAMRTWLGCYYICANVSMPSQQPSLLCWNQYMDDCIEALETSALALPSDKRFCKHVRLQHATDEHSRNILADHFFRPGSISRPDTVEILENFKNQHATLDDSTLENKSDSTERLLYYSSTLYLHEVIAALDHGSDAHDSSFEETSNSARSSHTPLISSPEYLDSAYNVISIFTSLDLLDIRAMPTVFLIRVIHAITVPVTCSISNLSASSWLPSKTCPLNSSFQSKSLSRVERQLDSMMSTIGTWGSDWPASKLMQILANLRKRLHEYQDKPTSTATSNASSRNDHEYTFEDEDMQLSAAFLDLSTPMEFDSLTEQQMQFSFEDFATQEGGTEAFGDTSAAFWEDFVDLVPQDQSPMLLECSTAQS